MSMQVIGELFEQIVNSEEKIKKRFEALRKVNQEIQDFQEKIRSTKAENETILSNINITNHKLIQEEVELKWLQAREKILADQKTQSENENELLQKELDEISDGQEQLRDNFLKKCDDFLMKYNFVDNNYMKDHADCMKTRLDVLQKELDNTLQSIDNLNKIKEKQCQLKQFKKNLGERIDSETLKKEHLTKVLKDLKKERKHLVTTKENLMKSISDDPEIRRLNAELEESKSICLNLHRQHQRLATQHCKLQRSNASPIQNNMTPFSSSSSINKAGGNPWKVPSVHSYALQNKPTSSGAIMDCAFTSAKRLHNRHEEQGKRFRYQPTRKQEKNNSDSLEKKVLGDIESCFSEEIEQDLFDFGLSDEF